MICIAFPHIRKHVKKDVISNSYKKQKGEMIDLMAKFFLNNKSLTFQQGKEIKGLKTDFAWSVGDY
jgi:hypothetical protein